MQNAISSRLRDGRTWADIEADMTARGVNDMHWTSNRNFAASYYAGDDVTFVAREAFIRHMGDNVTHRFGLHPSIQLYLADVLDFVQDLLNAPENATGTVTTGGSESLSLAMLSAREWAREHKPDAAAPEIIIMHSTYPVFNKVAHMMGLKVVQIPHSVDFRADVEAVRAAVNENTIMIVGSAPPFPYGLVDPLPQLSEIALANQIWLHSDACLGGFILPFVEALGRHVPTFDFRLPGLKSMSIDFHKYGYSFRGCSAVLLRDRELAKYHTFSSGTWPAGDYRSDTLAGSRSAGPVASAWAAINYLGFNGYRDRIEKILAVTDHLIEGINGLESFAVHGEPEGVYFSFGSNEFDMIAVGDALMKRGWMMNLQTQPVSLQLQVGYQHTLEVANEFLADLSAISDHARNGELKRADKNGVYGIY
ncbi:pyridoxal phosphate-dependent decarboxylase family protein [Roseibium sp. SCP14]|uniref:pyridoxal phosphate-dependent decarboxylase family protein n=1 Tax=Roseibium sp. SCP14 TaxID=3141375 RepID=UPI003336569F